MLTINKKIKITAENSKVEFDLENKLPEGEYEAQLLIEDKVEKMDKEKKFDLRNWSSGIKLEKMPSFRREEMYGEDGR
jgi:hypothetical protein